jgi:hypothetical protein
MESVMQFAGDYWPYLLGLFFVVITLLNMRSWWQGRQAEAE